MLRQRGSNSNLPLLPVATRRDRSKSRKLRTIARLTLGTMAVALICLAGYSMMGPGDGRPASSPVASSTPTTLDGRELVATPLNLPLEQEQLLARERVSQQGGLAAHVAEVQDRGDHYHQGATVTPEAGAAVAAGDAAVEHVASPALTADVAAQSQDQVQQQQQQQQRDQTVHLAKAPSESITADDAQHQQYQQEVQKQKEQEQRAQQQAQQQQDAAAAAPKLATNVTLPHSAQHIPQPQHMQAEAANADHAAVHHHEGEALPLPVDASTHEDANSTASPAGLFAFRAVDIDGKERQLTEFASARLVLVVNVASACAFTDENYKGLNQLYSKYHQWGLEILAFPCNQFANQEPKNESEIKEFCWATYQVKYPMFSKVEVNGPNAHPIFTFLKRHLPEGYGGGGGKHAGQDLVWNFQKILVDHKGCPLQIIQHHYDAGEVETAVYNALVADNPAYTT